MTGSFESPVPPRSASTSDVAKDEVRGVADDAKQRGQDVAHAANDEARQVLAEARSQTLSLFSQLRSEVTDQSATQNQRAAAGLHNLAGELGTMAQHGQSGVATDLVRQASTRLDEASSWLGSREPAQILDEVRRFARRRPGAFLAGAAAVGFIGGRLTRSLSGGDDSAGASSGQTMRRTSLHAPTANEYDVIEDYRPDTVHETDAVHETNAPSGQGPRQGYRPDDPATAADSMDPVDPVDPEVQLSGPAYGRGERT